MTPPPKRKPRVWWIVVDKHGTAVDVCLLKCEAETLAIFCDGFGNGPHKVVKVIEVVK